MKDFISFPALHLKFSISDTIVQFNLFGVHFTLKWYGLLIAAGFLLAVVYAMRHAPRFDIDPDRLIDVTLVSAIFAFLGARLYYVLFSSNVSYYFEKPARILQVWEGGLAIYGGIILAFATAVWMCRVRKVNTLAMFDIASIGFLIGQGIGRWGNFFNQEAFGGNTKLPWGMTGSIIQQGVNGQNYDTSLPVHPTFLYESLWCLAGFLLLHYVSKNAYKFKGQLFSMYIMWYGLGRFMIESLRTDSLMLGATMKVSQIVAVLSVIGGAVLFFLLRARQNSLPVDLFAGEADGTVPATDPDAQDENAGNEESGVSEASESEEAEAEPDTGETSKSEDVQEENALDDTDVSEK